MNYFYFVAVILSIHFFNCIIIQTVFVISWEAEAE